MDLGESMLLGGLFLIFLSAFIILFSLGVKLIKYLVERYGDNGPR